MCEIEYIYYDVFFVLQTSSFLVKIALSLFALIISMKGTLKFVQIALNHVLGVT